jgi:hypothetical protein
MVQITINTEDLEQLIEIAREHSNGSANCILWLSSEHKIQLAESIEITDALDEDLAESVPTRAPKPNNVQDGWVVGTVSTNKAGSESEFLVCSLQAWEECTEEESEELFLEALMNNINVGY